MFSAPQTAENIMEAIQIAVEQFFDVPRAADHGEYRGGDPHRRGADSDVLSLLFFCLWSDTGVCCTKRVCVSFLLCLCMNTGSPATSARCGFRRRLWSPVVIALSSAATTHPWAAAIRTASLRRISWLASCAIVSSMKSSSSKLEGSRSCRPKTRWTGENQECPTRRLSSAKVKSIFILRSWGFQTACFLECHEQGCQSRVTLPVVTDLETPW